MSGKGKPKGFNLSLSAFPEKGEQEDDTREEVTRDPADTRPLSLKNCDNKTLAGVVNFGVLRRQLAAGLRKASAASSKEDRDC